MSPRHTVRMSVVVLAALATFTSGLPGQSPIPGPRSSILTSAATDSVPGAAVQERGDSLQRDIRPTHWKEGALVGGLVGVASGALLGGAICRNSDDPDRNCGGTAVLSGLIVGLVLAIPGALIGGQIPKGGAAE